MALIYSNYLETMIPKGFTWHEQTWMWCEADLMYYNVEDDEEVDYDLDSALKRIALGQFKPL
jgi:hypothetical protein